MTPEQIGRICHEANRAYCIALGDDSQHHWDDAPQWQRESIIEGVKAAISDTTITAEQSHDGWCRLKRAEGWRYGPRKDEARKLHPCLVPYGDLPIQQRTKDHLFLAIVRTTAREEMPP